VLFCVLWAIGWHHKNYDLFKVYGLCNKVVVSYNNPSKSLVIRKAYKCFLDNKTGCLISKLSQLLFISLRSSSPRLVTAKEQIHDDQTIIHVRSPSPARSRSPHTRTRYTTGNASTLVVGHGRFLCRDFIKLLRSDRPGLGK